MSLSLSPSLPLMLFSFNIQPMKNETALPACRYFVADDAQQISITALFPAGERVIFYSVVREYTPSINLECLWLPPARPELVYVGESKEPNRCGSTDPDEQIMCVWFTRIWIIWTTQGVFQPCHSLFVLSVQVYLNFPRCDIEMTCFCSLTTKQGRGFGRGAGLI